MDKELLKKRVDRDIKRFLRNKRNRNMLFNFAFYGKLPDVSDDDDLAFREYDLVNKIKKVKHNNEKEYELDTSESSDSDINDAASNKLKEENEKSSDNEIYRCSSCHKKMNKNTLVKKKDDTYYRICENCRMRNKRHYLLRKSKTISQTNNINDNIPPPLNPPYISDTIKISSPSPKKEIIKSDINNNTRINNKNIPPPLCTVCSSCHAKYKIEDMGINIRTNRTYNTCPTCRLSKNKKYNTIKKTSLFPNNCDNNGLTKCSYCGCNRKYEEMGINNRTKELFSKCIYCRNEDKKKRYIMRSNITNQQ